MKKTILTLATIALMTGAIFTSYGQEPDKKSVKARENLKEAQKDSVSEYQKFKKESEEGFVAHEKSIADFKARITKEKKEDKAQYEKKLAALEQKNNDLKKKLDNYKEAGKDKWTAFKNKFNHDMDGLERSLKNFTISKNK